MKNAMEKTAYEWFSLRRGEVVSANILIDGLMKLYLKEEKTEEEFPIGIEAYVTIGFNVVYDVKVSGRTLAEGDLVITPAGILEIGTAGSGVYVKEFGDCIEDEFDDVPLQCQKMRNCFLCAIGFVSDVITSTMKGNSALLKWNLGRDETARIIENSIIFYHEVADELLQREKASR